MTLRDISRRAGVGRWWLHNYHRRFPYLSWLLRFGPVGAARYVLGNAAMRRAAGRLPAFECAATDGFSCSFMTGNHYWYQTLFCAQSLAQQIGGDLRVTVLDDGTLRSEQTALLRRVLRGVRIVPCSEAEALLDKRLPRDRFPQLRTLRNRMPMLRKLVDLRAGGAGWQLYLDSDMLFWRKPDFLEECERTRTPCHMADRLHAYSLPVEQLAPITGRPVPSRVNAGIVGLDDAAIDWSEIELWVQRLPPAALNPQLLEQTLTAMLLGTFPATRAAPGDDYHILYTRDAVPPPQPVVLHYIYQAKLRYFTRDWRLAAKTADR